MCSACWEKYGSPQIINIDVLKAAELISAIYKFNEHGGDLHIQLDDWNIEDKFFQRFDPFRKDATEEELEIERQCFEVMKRLSIQERVSALALNDGYWSITK